MLHFPQNLSIPPLPGLGVAGVGSGREAAGHCAAAFPPVGCSGQDDRLIGAQRWQREHRAVAVYMNGKGGFCRAGDPLEERMKLLPWLELVSAKGGNFDDGYRMVDIDVPRYVQATEARGFRGLYSIELWGGRVPDPVKAIASMRDTILANLAM